MVWALRKQGFTIVELLVVIVVIGTLASLVISVSGLARERAQMTSVHNDLALIKKSMLAYKAGRGELPPTGDFCNHCGYDEPNSSWGTVLNVMQADGVLGSARPEKDPWGKYYGYDDNDCNSNPGQSWVWSMGPDMTRSTSDDIRILVSAGCTQS